MAEQNRVTLDSYDAVQPTKFDFKFATTMTEDSGRPQSGKAQLTPLFTAESYSVEYNNLKIAEASKILQIIVPKRRSPFFKMKRFSPYKGAWATDQFYVGDGSLSVKTLVKGGEIMESISFEAIGRDPIA